MWQLYLPRILTAFAVMAVLVSIFLSVMKEGGSTFDYGKLWAGSFVANDVFGKPLDLPSVQ